MDDPLYETEQLHKGCIQRAKEKDAENERLRAALDAAIEGIKVGWQMDTDLGEVGYGRAERCLKKIDAALEHPSVKETSE